MARVLAVALAAFALAGSALAAGNPPKLHGSLAPPSPRLKPAAAKRIFLQHPKVADWLRHYPRGRADRRDLQQGDEALDGQGLGRRGGRGRDRQGRRHERRGHRGLDRAAGGVEDGARLPTAPSAGARSTATGSGSASARSSCSGSATCAGRSACAISTCSCCSRSASRSGSSTAATSSRACRWPTRRCSTCSAAWSGARWRGRLGAGAVPVWPVWLLAAATVFTAGFRIGLNVRASNVIDVGYSGVIGADRIAHGQVPYGHFPVETRQGVRAGRRRRRDSRPRPDERALRVGQPAGRHLRAGRLRGVPARLPRARLDRQVGRPARGALRLDRLRPALPARARAGRPALRRHAAGGDARLRLGRVSVHAVRLELEHERRAAAAVSDLGLLARQLARRPRRVHRALGLDEVRATAARAALGLVSGTSPAADARLRRRLPARKPGGVLDPGARRPPVRAPRTSSGSARSPGSSTASSPFSIWDWRQYHAGLPDLHILQRVLEGALLVGAVAVYFVPRRKSPLQLAALTAALLLGFELVLTHWFYLYLPWFFPFAAFAVLAAGRRAASRPRPSSHLSVLAKSWSASTEPRRLLVGAAGLFLVSLTLLHWGWYQHDLILDTVEYHRYGSAIADGHVPYRDFAVEYPPGALPAFGIPAIGKPSFDVLQPRVPDPDGALRGRLAGGDVGGAARARRLGRADGGRARVLRARAARARLGDPLPLRPLADLPDGGRARGGAGAAGAARVRRARARDRGEGLPGGRRSRRRSPTSGARAAGARRCSAWARQRRSWPSLSSRSSRSRRTASGTASSGRRRGRCRSRASARRCCSPRTTRAGSG